MWRSTVPKILDRYGGRSIGVDVPSGFGISFKPGTIMYDGTRLPVRPRRIDWVLAIEVCEHIPNFESLLDELKLTLKEGGLLFITTPWSTRVHYEPNDFLRPTPYLIDLLLRERGFELAWRGSRGNLASVLFNKLTISVIDNLRKPCLASGSTVLSLPLLFVLWPFTFVKASKRAALSSDPLGFSFLYRKIA